jgi:levanase/fructan beta-fructosidase
MQEQIAAQKDKESQLLLPEMVVTMPCLGKSAPLRPAINRIQLWILVDRTSLEVFGNIGRVVLTSCFLPPDENRRLEIFAVDGAAQIVEAKAYPLESIWH